MATTASELGLVDPAMSPYLSGRFAPVHREISTAKVAVEGDVPNDLIGSFIRNGPNPKFTPLGSYLYPIEGDGMLHAVSFGPDAVHYRNRWVRTRGLEAEERAGRALFGGIMTPAFIDPALLGPDPDPGWPIKLDAFINVVAHDGRYLALEEGLPAYEVSADLETIGPATFDIDAMLAGGPMLSWQPDLGRRIAVIPRDGSGPVRWIETDAYWVWHYANAYESGNTIAMGFPHWNVPGFLTPDTKVTGAYVRAVLDLDAGTIEFETVQDAMTEFPASTSAAAATHTGTSLPLPARVRYRSHRVSTTRCTASISRPGRWRSTRRVAQSAKPCSRRSREVPASSTATTSRS